MSQTAEDVLRRSPFRLVTVVLITIFVVEFTIMAVLGSVGHEALGPWTEALVDSTLLSVTVLPVLYLLVFQPLQQQIAELQAAQTSLREMRDELEVRVRERTTELERRSREMSLLSEMSDFLQACTVPDEAYEAITRTARQLFPGTSGALFVFRASRNDLEAMTSWGGLDLQRDECFFVPDACWALRRGRLYRIDDTSTGMHCAHVPAAVSAQYLCVPMMAQGEVLGVVHVRRAPAGENPPDREDPLDSRLAVTLTEHISLALTNLRLRDTLREQSIRDPLTGLFNRRYMEATLEREVGRAERGDTPLGVVMMDLDHFKRFNDDFGHEAGDLLLRELGSLLRSQFRGNDIACRYGGEELTLILPETSLASVMQRVETLRQQVKGLNLRHRGSLLGAVTLSAGIAMFPDHGKGNESLLRAADLALYRAKSGGRDRVVVAESLGADVLGRDTGDENAASGH